MKISVIIPTYNGAHKISNLLHSLENQECQPDEVIVVIDGSTDNTAALLNSTHFKLPLLRVIEQANSGRSQVRNRGVQEATGDLLIFFDDDMRPLPHCIAAHKSHQQQFPDSIMTGGLGEEITAASDDFLKFKAALSDRWTAPLKAYANKPMPAGTGFVTAANCSMSRKVWDSLGGFDRRLNDAEDYDLATRAQLSDIHLYFSRQAFAWHDDPVTCRSYIRRLRQYTVAQQRLQQLKPELYAGNNRFVVHRPAGIKKILFGFFCSRFWINSIDRGSWKLLPQSLRYRLYDWVVTANGSFFPGRLDL